MLPFLECSFQVSCNGWHLHDHLLFFPLWSASQFSCLIHHITQICFSSTSLVGKLWCHLSDPGKYYLVLQQHLQSTQFAAWWSYYVIIIVDTRGTAYLLFNSVSSTSRSFFSWLSLDCTSTTSCCSCKILSITRSIGSIMLNTFLKLHNIRTEYKSTCHQGLPFAILTASLFADRIHSIHAKIEMLNIKENRYIECHAEELIGILQCLNVLRLIRSQLSVLLGIKSGDAIVSKYQYMKGGSYIAIEYLSTKCRNACLAHASITNYKLFVALQTPTT